MLMSTVLSGSVADAAKGKSTNLSEKSQPAHGSGKGCCPKRGRLAYLNKGSPYLLNWFGRHMERFEVKRGVIKSMGGNAGLAKVSNSTFQ